MSNKQKKTPRPKARLPKGLRDIRGNEVRALSAMLDQVRGVYELYGFEPLETPALEYTDALGKFLPDVDRPNAGVFSLQDEDDQWMSLRYDLTAPLARFVAQNYESLPKPFRRYQTGSVWRNEKPGPGRYRQFTQIDADTIGAPPGAADAEMCMMAADCLEKLGIPRGRYVIRVNHRKLLDGILEIAGIDESDGGMQKLTVMRAMDKLDRLGSDSVKALLGDGRKDESGDFTKGATLNTGQIATLMSFVDSNLTHWNPINDLNELPTNDEIVQSMYGKDQYLDNRSQLEAWSTKLQNSDIGLEGIDELIQIVDLFQAAGYGSQRIQISPSIVRGLDYYTGPVFEAELTFEARNEDGQLTRFGSVGGGGRYDGLIKRFRGMEVPSTGFSLGVSRLYAALEALGQLEAAHLSEPVIVLVMDKDNMAGYQAMATELRAANIRAEVYLGGSGMRAQLKYADKRGAPLAIIEGGDERERGEVTLKDLVLGAQKAKEITDNIEWRSGEAAQVTVKRSELVDGVKSVLARHVP